MKMRARQAGFTLIEIVVAVAVLAMVGLIVFTATATSIRGRQVSSRMQERYQSARIAMMQMVRDLEVAYLSTHRNLDNYPKTLFLGTDSRIDFTYLGHRRFVEGLKQSDQGAVSFFLERDPTPGARGQALMRRHKVPVDERPERGGVVETLATGVKSLRFEYWDPEAQDWKRDWRAEMSDLDPVHLPGSERDPMARMARAAEALAGGDDDFMLPSRIKIRLVLEDETGREYEFESQARIYMREPFKW